MDDTVGAICDGIRKFFCSNCVSAENWRRKPQGSQFAVNDGGLQREAGEIDGYRLNFFQLRNLSGIIFFARNYRDHSRVNIVLGNKRCADLFN